MIQIDTMGEVYIFQQNDKYTIKLLFNNKNILKFYDPEENMEFLNRLFDVLGILDTNSIINSINKKYYVSKKFINYNTKYVELLKIMYTYDHKR